MSRRASCTRRRAPLLVVAAEKCQVLIRIRANPTQGQNNTGDEFLAEPGQGHVSPVTADDVVVLRDDQLLVEAVLGNAVSELDDLLVVLVFAVVQLLILRAWNKAGD